MNDEQPSQRQRSEGVLSYQSGSDAYMATTTVVLARFPAALEAELAAAKIEAEGLRVYLANDAYSSAIGLSVRPSVIRVDPHDLPSAVRALAATPARRFIDPEILEQHASGIAAPVTAIDIDEEPADECDKDHLCPHCGKHAAVGNTLMFWVCCVVCVGLAGEHGTAFYFLPVPLAIAFYWIRRRWYFCMQCGRRSGLF